MRGSGSELPLFRQGPRTSAENNKSRSVATSGARNGFNRSGGMEATVSPTGVGGRRTRRTTNAVHPSAAMPTNTAIVATTVSAVLDPP